MNNLLQNQPPGTRDRLRRFAEIYLTNKDPKVGADMYWWFEAIYQAGLTQHDRAILARFEREKRIDELLDQKG
ncbi:MAG: hypothetical protein JO053_10910 [Acidobacteria bacterium]|nr:hypothetical protein [Acidobacteriota bacterium]